MADTGRLGLVLVVKVFSDLQDEFLLFCYRQQLVETFDDHEEEQHK